MITTKQVFTLLQGIWKFTRYVAHKKPSEELYEGTGYAVLLKESEKELKYHERVTLKDMSTQSEIKGYRTYKYIYNSEKDEITKYFDDGKLFYKIDVSDTNCSGKHLCIRDFYVAKYQFNNDNNFSLKYQVNGPQKDYTINTEYTRINEQDISLLGIVITNGEIEEL